MTENAANGARILGRLGSADGKGVVRLEDRFNTDIDDMWSALTDPARLARWYGEVEGDLRVGGEYRSSLFASGWEGTGRIESCEPPHRFVVTSKEVDGPYEVRTEVTLTQEGDQTIVVFEESGMALDLVAAFGAGNQIHVEDLAAYLEGRGRVDARTRFDELFPAYQALLVDTGE